MPPVVAVKLLRTDTTLDLSHEGQSGEEYFSVGVPFIVVDSIARTNSSALGFVESLFGPTRLWVY